VSEPFDPRGGVIVVSARLVGPSGDAAASLALDTGATTTLIDPEILVGIGCDLARPLSRAVVTTANGVQYLPTVLISRIEAIGTSQKSMEILAGRLPPSAAIDGLLGLDFLRKRRLAIDFRKGLISLR
jgi:predicted aspartyl protease